jgi:hypothetical protein
MSLRHILAWGLLALAPWFARPVAAACPQGDLGALPVVVAGVKVRPYSSTNISATTPATQRNCVFLEAVGTTPASLHVDHQLEEPGTGVPGPWPLVSSSSINISGGVSVTCGAPTANVARTAPASGSLAIGEVTDICCFVWEAESPGSCSELPAAGDLVRHTTNSGVEAEMPLLAYIPAGGTTCGLVGLEFLIVAVWLRRRRRSS